MKSSVTGRRLFVASPATLLAALLAAAGLGGCGQTLDLGEEMSTRVVGLRDAMQCRHLGNVRVEARAGFLPGDRAARLKRALETQARIVASEVGADTVAPSSEITDDEQDFRLYICDFRP